MGYQRRNFLATLFTLMLIMNGFAVDGKRTITKNRSSSSSSSSSRRITSGTHGSVTKPSHSHADVAKLSYSNHELNRRPAVTSAPKNLASAPAAQGPPPIGWNHQLKPQGPPQGAPQGPPPPYFQTNPIGGAQSNRHEAPPAYRPSNVPPPSYPVATNTGNTYGAGHAPQHPAHIQATNTHSMQSYPKQEYNSGTQHHSPNMYYPHPNSAPMGAGVYPGGGIAYPHGATFLPAGSALPPNAILVSQPQQSSSGPGFGTGLLTGALGGGLLGYALAPSGSKEVVHQAAPAPSNGERVIIINNGPPGSVTTSDVGGGTTLINSSGGVVPPANAPAPIVSNEPSIVPAPAAASEAARMPISPGVAATDAVAANAAERIDASTSATVQVPESAANTPPPAGGLICYLTMVNVTSPTDPSQMVEVQQPVCYIAPPSSSNGTETTPSASGSLPTSTEPAKLEEPVQLSGVNAATPTQKTSTALLPENSKIQQAAAGASSLSIVSFLTPTLFLVCKLFALGKDAIDISYIP